MAAMTAALDDLIRDLTPRLVDLRHDLHAHPQLAYEETYAAGRVQQALGDAGIDFEAEVAEDFAFYTQKAPSCFSFLGVRPADREDYPGLHTSQYDFNDDAIAIGVKLMCAWAMESE